MTSPAPRSRRRILLVDDHPLLRKGLSELINQEPDLMVAGEAEDGPQALQVLAETRFDLAIVDISLPGVDFDRLAHALHQGRATVGLLQEGDRSGLHGRHRGRNVAIPRVMRKIGEPAGDLTRRGVAPPGWGGVRGGGEDDRGENGCRDGQGAEGFRQVSGHPASIT